MTFHPRYAISPQHPSRRRTVSESRGIEVNIFLEARTPIRWSSSGQVHRRSLLRSSALTASILPPQVADASLLTPTVKSVPTTTFRQSTPPTRCSIRTAHPQDPHSL